VKITADTNLLIRVMLTADNPNQTKVAQSAVTQASMVAISISTLCEFVWVLRRIYKISDADIAKQIRTLLTIGTVALDRPAVEAGLAVLDVGGDFADGVIAYEGTTLGADEFVSFDKQAVTLLLAQGKKARLLT
jgi:predicted nucleic-acid-binding protein